MNKKILYGIISYGVVSIAVIFISFKHWIVTSLLGPLWYLSAIIDTVQKPFNYSDGVVRWEGEYIAFIAFFILIWLGGALLFAFSCTEHRKKKIFRVLLCTLWSGCLVMNTFFYGLLTV